MSQFLTTVSPDIYNSDNYIVLDFEVDTSYGDYGHAVHLENKLLLTCYKRRDSDVTTIWGDELDIGELIESIYSSDFLVAHNAKYELGWLRRAGLDLSKIVVFDTKLAEYVLLGNLAAGYRNGPKPRSTSLDMCCRRRGLPIKDPVVDTMMKHGINPVEIPRPWLEGRCKQDVVTTETVFRQQRDELIATNRLSVLLTRCILTPVLTDIEQAGVTLDPVRVREKYEQYTQRYNKLIHEMDEFTGGINTNSNQQLGEFLYKTLGFDELRDKKGHPKRTPKGNRLTDKVTLSQLVATTERQQKFIEMRNEMNQLSSALSKYLRFFIGICEQHHNRFHANFNQTTTATHRLSSSGMPVKMEDRLENKVKMRSVQFQNMPRVFKDLTCARRDGWFIGEADGPRMEFGCAAYLGQDVQAMEDIASGFDVHKFSASQLHGVSIDEVTKDMRQDAKPETFGPLYGKQFGTEAQMAYYEAFRKRYPDITTTQREWITRVLNSPNKCLITPWGLRYYFPNATMNERGYCNVSTNIYNYPIQALATAEIIPVAITEFYHLLHEHKLTDVVVPVNTVHDSLICEVHPDYVEQFKELALSAFTEGVFEYLARIYNLDYNVHLGVDIKIGTHWNDKDAEECSYMIDPTERKRK